MNHKQLFEKIANEEIQPGDTIQVTRNYTVTDTDVIEEDEAQFHFDAGNSIGVYTVEDKNYPDVSFNHISRDAQP